MNEKNEKKNKGWLVVLVLLLIAGLAVGGYFYLREKKPVDNADPKADIEKVFSSFKAALEDANSDKVSKLFESDTAFKSAMSSLPKEMKEYITKDKLDIKVSIGDIETEDDLGKAKLTISFRDYSDAIERAKDEFISKLSEVEKANKEKEEALSKEGLTKEEKEKLEKPEYLSGKDKEKLFASFLKDSLNDCKDTKSVSVDAEVSQVKAGEYKVKYLGDYAVVLSGNSLTESTKVLSEVKPLFKDDENYGKYSEVEPEKDKDDKDPDNGDKDPTGNGSGNGSGSTSGNQNQGGNAGSNTNPSNPGGNTNPGGSTGGSTGGNQGGNTTPSNPTQPEEPKYPYTMIKWGINQVDAYQCDICKKPFRDIPSLNAHYCVPMTPCTHDWEDITEKVHHDEVGHYENRCTQDAWDEPVYEYKSVCKVCGSYFDHSDATIDHLFSAHNGSGSYGGMNVQTGTIHHDAVYADVYVVDQKAYDEYVVTGQRCKLCGETK